MSGARQPIDRLALPEFLPGRADIDVGLVTVGEVGPFKGPVQALRLVEDRNVRLDPMFMNRPAEHLGRAVGAVSGQPLGIQAEAIRGSRDHRACAPTSA